MKNIEIYTTLTCGYCTQAKQLLQEKGLAFSEIAIGGNAQKALEMIQRSGRRTVPQVFIDGRPVGGYTQLRDLLRGADAPVAAPA